MLEDEGAQTEGVNREIGQLKFGQEGESATSVVDVIRATRGEEVVDVKGIILLDSEFVYLFPATEEAEMQCSEHREGFEMLAPLIYSYP